MRLGSTAALIVACGTLCAAAPAVARDPAADNPSAKSGPRPARDFVPERVDVSRLHPRPQAPAERRRLYERVEEDVDRGRGRIEDRQTYDVRRSQDDRDERLGRIPPRRDAERLAEEYDRQRRLDAAAAAAAARRADSGNAVRGSEASTIVRDVPPASVDSTLARVVAQDQRRLDAARERYQRDLRIAETERDEASRAARTHAEKSRATRAFVERRAALTRDYQAYRRGILGQ